MPKRLPSNELRNSIARELQSMLGGAYVVSYVKDSTEPFIFTVFQGLMDKYKLELETETAIEIICGNRTLNQCRPDTDPSVEPG